MFSTLNLRALGIATLATLGLVMAVVVGSRNLQNFDAALVPYWFGTLFAFFAIMNRDVVWLPLTFGWIHFGLKPGGISKYHAFVFGFPVQEFTLGSWMAANVLHILDWCSWAVIIGVLILMRRRLTDAGQIALQTFEGDWLPLILLLAISITGLGLTWDYDFMRGKYYPFTAVTHAITVIQFLIWIPFGKFFHIV